MNIEAEKLQNELLKEKRILENKYLLDHIKNIEKKILVSNSVGIDYAWYSLNKTHFKYNTQNIITKIISILEKQNFALRVFSKNQYYLIQIIWYNK